jgi:hypothetical protein
MRQVSQIQTDLPKRPVSSLVFDAVIDSIETIRKVKFIWELFFLINQ